MKKLTISSVALIALLALTSCSGGSGDGDTVPDLSNNDTQVETPNYVPFPDVVYLDEATKAEYLKVVNDVRSVGRYCGDTWMPPVAPLEWSDALYRSAYEHSYDMSVSKHYGHDGSGTQSDWTAQVLDLGRGSEAYERMENNGHEKGLFGENIVGSMDEDDKLGYAMSAWLRSEGHCEIMMNKNFSYIGMAMVGDYWTQNFGG